MLKRDFNQRLIVGLTAKHGKEWKNQLKEINHMKIKKIAVFIEEIKDKKIRRELYNELRMSCIREIPLVHIRDDTSKKEILFFIKNFKTKFFSIHEHNFNNLKKWFGYHKKLFLEMNYDNHVPENVNMNKIGGFCIDLAHHYASIKRRGIDYKYVEKFKNRKSLFKNF